MNAIVTCTTDLERSAPCRHGWPSAFPTWSIYTVVNGTGKDYKTTPRWTGTGTGRTNAYYETSEFLGVVPAFALGVQQALEDGAEIIACLHDDVDILDSSAGAVVYTFFLQHPRAGLVGFGGGRGLGSTDLYQTGYNPMQLARVDFVSNMVDAEAHGRRVNVPTRVACLDGFSQIGRREFWMGLEYPTAIDRIDPYDDLFHAMASWGVVHHFYDGMLGCFAKRLGWEAWMLPIRCRHLGGQTAVGDARYQQWARLQQTGVTEGDCGDAGFWKRAHQIGYDQFRDVLPIRLEEGEVYAISNP